MTTGGVEVRFGKHPALQNERAEYYNKAPPLPFPVPTYPCILEPML